MGLILCRRGRYGVSLLWCGIGYELAEKVHDDAPPSHDDRSIDTKVGVREVRGEIGQCRAEDGDTKTLGDRDEVGLRERICV